MCKRPSQTFVKLFLDEHVGHISNNSNLCKKSNITNEGHIATINTTAATADDTNTLQEGLQTTCAEELSAQQQERINNKLTRYKWQNKKLKQELQSERIEMEEMMVSTIQNFYKIVDKHEEERERLNRGAFELRQKLDVTLDQQSKERSQWKVQQKQMQQEIEKIKKDCILAEQNVQSATVGLAAMKLSQTKRQSKLQVLQQEKSKIAHENRELKKALLGSHDASRPECILW